MAQFVVIRLRHRSGLPVRRDGTSRGNPLQRQEDVPERLSHYVRAAGPDAAHRARDFAPLVRRCRDNAVVRRRVDQGGVCQLLRLKDLHTIFPGCERAAAGFPRLQHHRVLRGQDGRDQCHTTGPSQPFQRRAHLRQHRL